MDYQKLNQVVDPTTAIVPDMVSLLDVFHTWYGEINVANVFFSIPIKKVDRKQFDILISHSPKRNTLAFLPKGYDNPPFCLSISQRNIYHFDISTERHHSGPLYWEHYINQIS